MPHGYPGPTRNSRWHRRYLHRRQRDVAQRRRQQPDPDPNPVGPRQDRSGGSDAALEEAVLPIAIVPRARPRSVARATSLSRSGARCGKKTAPRVVILGIIAQARTLPGWSGWRQARESSWTVQPRSHAVAVGVQKGWRERVRSAAPDSGSGCE